jgi:hypothetical protein
MHPFRFIRQKFRQYHDFLKREHRELMEREPSYRFYNREHSDYRFRRKSLFDE